MVATVMCLSGVLTPSCAPLDDSDKVRCRSSADCIAGYECRNEQCLPTAQNCDECLVAGLYRPSCSIVKDSSPAPSEEASQRGFVIVQTAGSYFEGSDPAPENPGFDMDCSLGTSNPLVTDAHDDRWRPLGACVTSLFEDALPTEPTLEDAPMGVDNSFLRAFVRGLTNEGPLNQPSVATESTTWHMVVALTGYNGQPYDSEVSVAVLYSDRFEELATDQDSVDLSSSDGARMGIDSGLSYAGYSVPLFRDTRASVNDYQIVANLAQPGPDYSMPLKLFVGWAGTSTEVVLNLRYPMLTISLKEEDGELTGYADGFLSGIWYESEWGTPLQDFQAALGRSSCSGGTGNEADSAAVPVDGTGGGGGADDGSGAGDAGSTAGVAALLGGALRPLADRFGDATVFCALAEALDMHVYLGGPNPPDLSTCNGVSLVIGFRAAPAELLCPPSLGTGSSSFQSMSAYERCSL